MYWFNEDLAKFSLATSLVFPEPKAKEKQEKTHGHHLLPSYF